MPVYVSALSIKYQWIFDVSRDQCTYCIDNNLWIAIFAKFCQAASPDHSQITIERHKH